MTMSRFVSDKMILREEWSQSRHQNVATTNPLINRGSFRTVSPRHQKVITSTVGLANRLCDLFRTISNTDPARLWFEVGRSGSSFLVAVRDTKDSLTEESILTRRSPRHKGTHYPRNPYLPYHSPKYNSNPSTEESIAQSAHILASNCHTSTKSIKSSHVNEEHKSTISSHVNLTH